MEKENYIKSAFKNYKNNKKILSELQFDGVRGIDYTKTTKRKGAPMGHENALVSYIDKKAAIEKQVEIVERVIWFYRVDESPKADYIIARWGKGLPVYRVAMDLFIGETTAHKWAKEIFQTGVRAADLFDLWDK